MLDGNPLDEKGLGYLCQALMMNGNVESVSLRRCGLGERAGLLLLRLLGEKPGLEVDVSEGNPLGEELSKKVGGCFYFYFFNRTLTSLCSSPSVRHSIPLSEQ